MSPTPHTPPHGSSIIRFNTDLVDQIIEVEVDTAIRSLEQSGKRVSEALAHSWNRALQEMIGHMAVEEGSNHCILPRDFQETLQNMLRNLIDADSDSITSRKPKVAPQSLGNRLCLFFARLAGKKMPS